MLRQINSAFIPPYREAGLTLNGVIESPVWIRPTVNSSNQFGVYDSSSNSLFNIDGTNRRVTVSTSNTTEATRFLVGNGGTDAAIGTMNTGAGDHLLFKTSQTVTVFRVASTGATTIQNNTNSTSAFQIMQTTATNDVLFNADTTNNRIKIGNSTGTGTATTTLVLDSATSAPTGVAGAMYYDSTNNKFKCYTTTWTDCGSSGANRVRLSPEFPGGTLSADGSSNSGTMFADYDATARRNYYEWTSSQASAQDYDIIVSTMVPSNYSSGFTGFNIFGWRDNNTNASATITIEKEDGTSCLASTAITFSGSTSTWAESPHSLSCTPAANEILVIRIKVTASNSAKIRIGAIRYDYN